jgi:hypothetical protein
MRFALRHFSHSRKQRAFVKKLHANRAGGAHGDTTSAALAARAVNERSQPPIRE